MALMVNYCETHRWAWPVAERSNNCPFAEEGKCAIKSVDSIATIIALGGELAQEEKSQSSC